MEKRRKNSLLCLVLFAPHNRRVAAFPMFVSPTEMGSPVGLFHSPLTSNLLSGVM